MRLQLVEAGHLDSTSSATVRGRPSPELTLGAFAAGRGEPARAHTVLHRARSTVSLKPLAEATEALLLGSGSFMSHGRGGAAGRVRPPPRSRAPTARRGRTAAASTRRCPAVEHQQRAILRPLMTVRRGWPRRPPGGTSGPGRLLAGLPALGARQSARHRVLGAIEREPRLKGDPARAPAAFAGSTRRRGVRDRLMGRVVSPAATQQRAALLHVAGDVSRSRAAADVAVLVAVEDDRSKSLILSENSSRSGRR